MSGIEELLTEEYIIEEVAGRGAFSHVYYAVHRKKGIPVAVKVMDMDEVPSEEKGLHYDLFLREAQMLQECSHPGIPKFYDFFIKDNLMILVMEFVSGLDLETYLEKQGSPMEEAEVLDIFIQVCQVLSYLHNKDNGKKVIFRDIKPANIMIDEEGKVKLIDLATARIWTKGKKGDTVKLGTPGYAAPEAYGQNQTDEISDIYSIGASMFHLLTNKDPEKYVFKFPSIRELNPKVTSVMEKIVRDCLKQRDKRVKSVGELKFKLVNLKKSLELGKSFSHEDGVFSIFNSLVSIGSARISPVVSKAVLIALVFGLFALVPTFFLSFLKINSDQMDFSPGYHRYESCIRKNYKSRIIREQKCLLVLKESYEIYCNEGKLDKAMFLWREYQNHVSPYPLVMKKKLKEMPFFLTKAVETKMNSFISKVFTGTLSQYERYMNSEYMEKPDKEVEDAVRMVFNAQGKKALMAMAKLYILEPPVINYSRKIYITHCIARQLEKEGEKKAAIEILSYITDHKELKDIALNEAETIHKNLNIKSATSLDMLFIEGEILRLSGKKKEANEYYRKYVSTVRKSKSSKSESYEDVFREVLFYDNCRRDAGDPRQE